MTLITLPASLISLGAVFYLLYIFAVLSRKLGAVTKMKPYYRGLYWAMGFIGVALVGESLRLTSVAAPEAVPWQGDFFYLLSFTVPLLAASVTALVVVLRYWSWLFREQP